MTLARMTTLTLLRAQKAQLLLHHLVPESLHLETIAASLEV